MLDLLQNKLNLQDVPFSFPGSRLVLYHYKDKQALYLRLAERLTKYFPGIESYTQRDPFLQDIQFLRADLQPLQFSVQASPQQIVLQTNLGTLSLYFSDEKTLCIQFPPHTTIGLSFRFPSCQVQKNSQGGILQTYRTLTYATNAALVKNEVNEQVEGPSLTLLLDTQDANRLLIHIDLKEAALTPSTAAESTPAAAQIKWQSLFSKLPPVREEYRFTYAYAWWVLFNNMFNPQGHLHYRTLAPSKLNYVGIWLWDNALHTLALRHVDPNLARDQIRAFLAHQQPNGMLPDAIFDDGLVTHIDHPFPAPVTKPPILAWAALKIDELDPDITFFKEIYEPLTRWNAWWFDENDDDHDGYIQYIHPYSSGLDDHPAWDGGMPVESPDLNTYLYLQMEALAFMADHIDKHDAANSWRLKSKHLLNKMVQKTWDEKAGLFQVLHQGHPVPVLSPLNLYPLWTAALPQAISKKLIHHLSENNSFYGKWMLPSVARSDPAFDQDRMWRGPVWANMTYFFIEALHKNGEIKLARELRQKLLALIIRNEGIYEYYNALSGMPGKNAAPAFSWSASVFIDLAIQASKDIEKN